MNVQVRLWITLGWLLSGCFHDAEALRAPVPTEAIKVTVRDMMGAVWPLTQAPRTPVFTVELDASPAASPPLYLVAGDPDDELLQDLAQPPLRAATTAALLPLKIESSEASLRAQPEQPLQPGGRYSLVWAAQAPARPFPFVVSQSPAAGAALAETWPADGSNQVPPNIQRGLFRFDGHLTAPPTIRLREAGSARETPATITSDSCATAGFPAGHCVWIAPRGPLNPNAAYELSLSEGARDLTGTRLPAATTRFRTAAEADHTAPALVVTPCALDEQSFHQACLLLSQGALEVRAQADESSLVQLLAPPEAAASIAFFDGFSLNLALPPKAECPFLRLADPAGNALELPLSIDLPTDLASLGIDEVRANPVGTGSDQEYVELLNFGPQTVLMTGFTLTDDPFQKGQTLRDVEPIGPGERVLVVGPRFDRHAEGEVIPESVRLVRLDSSLGLSDAGTPLYLRDDRGRRLSASPRIAPEREGQCIARVSSDLRTGSTRAFILDPQGTCTPGTSTEVPTP